MSNVRVLLAFSCFFVCTASQAQQDSKKAIDAIPGASIQALKPRLIGPAVASGRVVGFAMHPRNRDHYYVAVACGGVWKTTNAGTTWTPLFDQEGSYSIGYVALDPKNPDTVWVGTGENNSQRSVGYGDGVYRSDDAGKSWKKVGLDRSEHIGKILIDPRDSNVVYVAAQGPLWGPGGDRGLYKTTDGGKTWKAVLTVSENTGVTDVVLDPRNPDVLIAAAYQRRRHVWTLINGGPESALYRSTDGGATWTKLRSGLPTEELGRIGLAVAPSSPQTVYAIVEAADRKGGIFRSNDFGVTWEKRNDFDQQAQYYAHLVVDPKNAERLYVMNVYIMVSDDGGKSLRRLGERWKHVDSHCMWIDPNNPSFYRVGCDGGIYESHDRGANWRFLDNLPITQFYDITVDEDAPFYHVYGGTQDNDTLGGPARTRSAHGITNADWFVTLFGDGFQCKVDPKDRNTVYCEYQYGGLARYDRRTGERVDIQPQPGKGEPPYRWNWDSPLVLSPHANTRLYFAANKVFRSDDRGNSWKTVSGDLTRQLDRDKLPVMGKLWGPDAVAKHLSTSFYGNLTALAESPRKEGLLYVGSDDGLVHVFESGGGTWRPAGALPGVPERTYVSRILPSQHDAQTVYVALENHKMADFKPYLLKSTDAGHTWVSIAGDLPANGPVLAVAEDHGDRNLLFVGTEFGLFFTTTGGQKWTRLKNGLPTIAVRDLAIQKQMNDLVIGTFGRGIYVLDDYTPLRNVKETTERESHLFSTRDAILYIPSRQYGLRGKAFLGEGFYAAENPPFGATFTYYLKETLRTKKQQRRDQEKAVTKNDGLPAYPSKDQLRAEAEEEAPVMLLTVRDADGTIVRTLTGPVTAGMHRITWDLREPAASLPRPRAAEGEDDAWVEEPGGPLVMPGTYSISLAKRVDGVTSPVPGTQQFQVVLDRNVPLTAADAKMLREFQQKAFRLQRAVAGALETANGLTSRLEQIKKALDATPQMDGKWKEVARTLEKRNRDLLRTLRGDSVLRGRNENTPVSVSERISRVVGGVRFALAVPTGTQQDNYRIASEEFAQELATLRALLEGDLRALERALDAAGAPWTPGRLPEWRPHGFEEGRQANP